jgi:hypothetical protein
MSAVFLLVGCSPPAAPVGQQGPISPSRPTTHSAAAASGLLAEVQRELAAMRTSRYQHSTDVDEDTGRYFYDCSGMIDYAAGRALPADARALPTGTSSRPLAADIEHYLHDGLHRRIDGWTAIPRTDALGPGDVIAWLATEDSTTGDTGHVMLVLAPPQPNARRSDEWLVSVADSTLSPHASDSRHKGDTGLGTGTIGLVADGGGPPTAFYWRGGQTAQPKPTEIALGRPA